ncbi:CG34454, partial [Drosophila busckii]
LIFSPSSRSPVSVPQPQSTPAPPAGGKFVLVNNVPTLVTRAPFVAAPPPTQQFLDCFGRCPTTPEYNPVCASNMQTYLNQQKFDCARFCGADIQIVRRSSCEGLFPMQRG